MFGKEDGKILYLEGLRGIASVMVFLLHFILAFFPAAQRGNPLQVHNSVELILSNAPLVNIIYGGHFAVYIFFVLSGYVLTVGYFRSQDRMKLVRGMLKRYIRLEIPIFVSIFVSYVLLSNGIYKNMETSFITLSFDWLNKPWQFEPSFLAMFKQAVFDVFYDNNVTL